MRVKEEFSKNAKEYEKYNIIQRRVAKELIKNIDFKPKKILDIGSGSGLVFKNISWEIERFYAIDFSKEMLNLHPSSPKIIKKEIDFNSKEFENFLANIKVDFIISASALQWAKDLEKVFKAIKNKNTPFALAIFSSNTFKTIHKFAKITSPIKSKDEIIKAAKILDANIEVINFELSFEKKEDIFKYIKKSGVSGGRNILSFSQTKNLIKNYPFNFLEFEIVFIRSNNG